MHHAKVRWKFIRPMGNGGCSFWRDVRSVTAVEFALIMPVFLALMLMVFEISYDLFLQEVLDNSLQLVARDIQVGSAQNATSPSSFISSYVCPASTNGLLNCNSLFIRVEEMNFSTGTCTNLDFYDATGSGGPVSGGSLNLGGYWSASGQGSGSTINRSPCATTNTYGSSYPGYCNPAPQSMVLISAVYVAPSFLAGLLNPVFYKGSYTRPIIATAAFTAEPFIPIANRPLPC